MTGVVAPTEPSQTTWALPEPSNASDGCAKPSVLVVIVTGALQLPETWFV